MNICRNIILNAINEMTEHGTVRYEPPKAVWPQLKRALQEDDLKTIYELVKSVAPRVSVSDDQIVDVARRIAFHDRVRGEQRHHKRTRYLIMRAIGEAFTAVEGFQYFHSDTPKKGDDFSPEAYAAVAIIILTLQRRGVGGKYGLGVCGSQIPRNANRFYWSHMPTPYYEAWDAWDAAMEQAIIDCAELLRSYSIKAVNEHGKGYEFNDEQDEVVTFLDACVSKRVGCCRPSFIRQEEVIDVYLAATGYNSGVPWSDFPVPDWVIEAYSVVEEKKT